MEDPNQAIEWLMQLISVVPTDSHALAKLGELYDSEGDKSQAFQYYYEVCRLKLEFCEHVFMLIQSIKSMDWPYENGTVVRTALL